MLAPQLKVKSTCLPEILAAGVRTSVSVAVAWNTSRAVPASAKAAMVQRFNESQTQFTVDNYPLTQHALDSHEVIVVRRSDPRADPAEVAVMRETNANMRWLQMVARRSTGVAAAQTGNMDQIKAAFGGVVKSCDNCHDNFRNK